MRDPLQGAVYVVHPETESTVRIIESGVGMQAAPWRAQPSNQHKRLWRVPNLSLPHAHRRLHECTCIIHLGSARYYPTTAAQTRTIRILPHLFHSVSLTVVSSNSLVTASLVVNCYGSPVSFQLPCFRLARRVRATALCL